MPLRPGTDPETLAQNIREMVASGHPQNVAVAAAEREKDASSHKAHAKPKTHTRKPPGKKK